MNSEKLKEIREIIEKKLREIEQETTEVSWSIGNIVYQNSHFSIMLEGEIENLIEDKDTAIAEFKRFANEYGLSVDDYGKAFGHMGRRYKIIGIDNKRGMVILDSPTGEARISPEELKKMLGYEQRRIKN